jgi:2,3-bisphosphoglycerate-dependent phosphoglycerate mutase
LRGVLNGLGVEAIYSSPYPRAVDTVRPFAEAHDKPIHRVEALRERCLTPARLLEHEWRTALARCWAEPDFALPGGESNLACQGRVVAAIEALSTAHAGQTLLVASHGNALALFLSTLDGGFGHEGWKSMSNPDLYRVCYDNGRPIGRAQRIEINLGS